jgi:hypothetical protein
MEYRRNQQPGDLDPDILPVKPLSRIKLHLIIGTNDPVMEQIEFEAKAEDVAALKEAQIIMVGMELLEGGATKPNQYCDLIFPPEMFQH